MAEGKKLAIQKRGREVELRTVEKPRGGTPYDGLYGEAKPSLHASSPIWASEANRARTGKRPAKPRGADDYFSRYTPNGELARGLGHARRGYLFPGFRYNI